MAIAWAAVIIWIGAVIFMNRKVHPKALFFLFFAEFWERFSYYGMRALLVLYMVSALKYTKKDAYGVYAAYGAMVYATPILGGLIAEKLFGYQKAILWGGILMAAGHFAMAFEYKLVFFLALALLILGNGFFKPNISSFISTFYEKNDPRKDGAYTLFYMGINAGAFLTPLTCGAIGEIAGWHYGFGLAGVGMVLGLVVFMIGQRMGVFEDKGAPPDAELLSQEKFILPNEWLIYLASILALPLLMILIQHNEVLDVGLGLLGVSMLGYLVVMGARDENHEEGQRLWVIVILLLFTTLFWTFFELAGSAITLYTKENVNKVMFGQKLATSMFQSVNPLFIILLAPAFSGIWNLMNKKNIEPSAPIKFSLGLILLGVGFFGFTFGQGFAKDGMVPVYFLIFAYLLHTLGELCLSPVGLSLVTKLSPTRIVGFIMGIWFLSSSIAHQAGKFVAGLTAPDTTSLAKDLFGSFSQTPAVEFASKLVTLQTYELTPAQTLPIYTKVFTTVGFIAVAAGVFLLLLSPIIKKWMHGIR
tara:strand:+ start:35261 stop:36853 length:1593 start_codon:yes stop_codon:yes gene_type:complete